MFILQVMIQKISTDKIQKRVHVRIVQVLVQVNDLNLSIVSITEC